MSGREMESALHLGLVFQQIPETSTVPATSGETSRKRTADVEPAADVPSASRRRRNANTDASSYIRPTFPSCCVNGVVDQTCLIPSSPGYDPTTTAAVQPPITPIFGPQVIAPQVHAQLATVPSSSIVHNVTPIALHLHGLSPSVASNYAYFLPHPAHHMIQPLMGLRLPTTPVQYMSQDIPFPDQAFLPSLISDIPENIQRSLEELPAPPAAVPTAVNGGNNWDTNVAQYRLYPGFPYLPRPINTQMETVASRVRIAQAAAQVGVDPTAATQMLANQAHGPIPVDYYADGSHNPVPLVEGPVAVPTMAAEWAPPPPAPIQDNDAISAVNYHQQLERLASGEIPFRAWEAAVLHIFDRITPQMNAARLPPKGMTKNEIDKLKSFRVTDPALLMEKVCVICQCDFEKRDLVRMLPCAHHFHLKCIDKWLKGNRTCPICRQNVAPEVSDSDAEVTSAMATATATAVVMGTATGTGTEHNNVTDENNSFENSRAAVQVITHMGPDDAALSDSSF
ncbi:E3 ubiquitin-protein ligase [Dirofilaria immitis]|nr:RING finger protein 38 [Dirofilaria immitis]